MARQSSDMFGWSWTEVIVLGSQVFGQATAILWKPIAQLFFCIPKNVVIYFLALKFGYFAHMDLEK